MVMLSIIIPVGPGRDARTALASLPAAGLNEAHEVIVVGDGHSLDVPGFPETAALRVLATGHPVGANAVRNLGAHAARHPFLCFLDDDDAYLPGALGRIEKTVAGEASAGAWSLAWRMRSGRPSDLGGRPDLLEERHLWRRNRAGGCSSMVVRKEAFEEAACFDEAMPAMQDWDLWLRLSRNLPIRSVQDPMVLYNDLPGPRISTNFSSRIAGLERLLAKHGEPWPRSVRAFHEARLASERVRAGIGRWRDIPRAAAPVASLLFLFKALKRS